MASFDHVCDGSLLGVSSDSSRKRRAHERQCACRRWLVRMPIFNQHSLSLHVTKIQFIMLHVTLDFLEIMMRATTSERVQKHRNALRASGLRPVQIWVPDTRRANFAEECRRQSMSLRDDAQEQETMNWHTKCGR